MSNLIGQRVGQYEILSLLGKGGMAVVYRARQSSIGRDVAIKVIKPDLAETEEFERRFQREAEAIASLSHPFILKVFDYGQQGDLVYLVTELLKGGSLAEAIRKGPLSPESARRALDQVASALDYAHERGIIHRDLKPANVLLDEKGNAHLTDFGIAKILSENSALTQSGATMGTPAYMSPEQWQGKALDARADIYALGIMLFEMLTGELPFKADTAYSMMHMHVNEPVPSVRQLKPSLPAGVEKVINRALAKNPDERFSSAGEVAAAYNAALFNTAAPILSPSPETSGIEGAELTAKSPLFDGETVVQAGKAAPSRTLPLGIGVVVLVLAAIGGLILLSNRQGVLSPSSTPTTAVALAPATSATVASSPAPSYTPSETPLSPTFTFTPTNMPTNTLTATPTIVSSTPTLLPPTETPLPATPAQVPTPGIASLPVISAANAAQIHLYYNVHSGAKVASIAFSPDGTLLAVGRNDDYVSLWDMRANAFTARLEGLTSVVFCIAFSPDGTMIAAGDTSGHVQLWDTKTGALLRPFKGHSADVARVIFSRDGKTLYTGSWDSTIRIWDVNSGKLLATLQSTSQIYDIALSPDETLLASANQDSAVHLWDVKQHTVVAVMQGHDRFVASVAFSPDGTLLASGGKDGTVRLWDVAARKQKAVLRGHVDEVRSVAFSPDGTLLASGSSDMTARLWEVSSGNVLTVFKGHTDEVYAAAFSPDGKLLATASLDGTVHLGSAPVPGS